MGGRIMGTFLITKSNMKKKKSSLVLLLVLVSLSTLLLYTGLNVTTNVNKLLDEKNKEQNGADFFMTTPIGFEKQINDILHSQDKYSSSEDERCTGLLSYNIKNLSNKGKKKTLSMILYNIENDREISNLKIIQKGKKLKDNSIVLPAFLNISEGYNVGDKVEIYKDKNKYEFEVYGFTEDVMLSTPSSVSLFKIFASQKMIDNIESKDVSSLKLTTYNVKTKPNAHLKDFEDNIFSNISKKIKDPRYQTVSSMNYDTMSAGTGYLINIMMSIISVFSVLIVVVSFIVIRFSINTSIESNMQNIGVLKASGYTSKQLKKATVVEYVVVSVIGTFIGLILSIGTSKIIGNIVSSSLGLYWNKGFNIITMLGCALLINISILIVTIISANKFKKVTPLIALRGGIDTHNFRKNHLKLSTSKLDINSSLGLKGILNNKKQSIPMVVIVMMLSIFCVISGNLYYNFYVNQDAFLNIIGVEKSDILVRSFDASSSRRPASREKIRKIYDEIENYKGVDYTIISTSKIGNLVKDKKNISLDIEGIENFDKLRVNPIIRGRAPKHDNEIMVTNVILKELNSKLGGTIYIEMSGERKEYIVVGVYQQSSDLGRGAKITTEGMDRICSGMTGDIYVYLKEGANQKKIVKDLKKIYKDSEVSVVDFIEFYDSIFNSFAKGIELMTSICLAVALLVILLILYMLIKIKLLKDRKIYGVYKALGYTTRQLMWQTTMNFAPIVSFGGLVGSILGSYLFNPIVVMAFSVSGIESCSFKMNPMIIIMTFMFITVVAFIISMICSRGVRKIEAYKMITE